MYRNDTENEIANQLNYFVQNIVKEKKNLFQE